MKKGDVGMSVRDLQGRLKRAGFSITNDGWYGDATEAAVRAFQRASGLVEDGIAGEKTNAMLMGVPPRHQPLSQRDIVAAAASLDIPVAAIMAVNEVESAGSGFLDDGRVRILYERHLMYRLLEESGIDPEIYRRAHPNVVNRERGGYAGGALEYQRLGTGMAIDKHCAIQATSWGQYQILGRNYQEAGFTTPEEFVAAMGESEARQLQAFVAFILADPALHKAIKSRKWPEFARLYNGIDYKANLYDVKLARAYDRYAAMNTEAS